MEREMDFNLRAKQLPLANITNTYHWASFIIFLPTFLVGAHNIKNQASHQHCNKSHDTLWLKLSKLKNLFLVL